MTFEQLEQLAEDPKTFLNQGYRAKARISAKQERIATWQNIAESTTAQLKPVISCGSLPSHKVETCVCNIVELQTEIRDGIQELVNIEHNIQCAINELVEDQSLRALLELRYLNYIRWEEISVRLDYTCRWTMALHKRALLAVAEKSFNKLSAKAR